MGRVFVIGASGYVGSALISHMRSLSLQVFSVGRLDSEFYLDLYTGETNLFDVITSADTVIFLAAISAPDICRDKFELAKRVNVDMTIDIIGRLLSNLVRVIFSSSDAVFGNASVSNTITDESELSPLGEYGEMKAAVEKTFIGDNLFKVVRFSYILGRRDKYTSMLLSSTHSTKAIVVFKGFERNVVALTDVVVGITKLVVMWNDFPYNRINFSGPKCISRWEVSLLISKTLSLGLELNLSDAPNSFWKGRAKRINMESRIFSKVLGRNPLTVNENVARWVI
ncbi:NAD-dependent epimerase/dehydratase family protein [Paraferrimonas haliotis]|uniref:NAD-dependent epimerase/dehydratase family protein n=1 Tax=Paraferrimonas haliotis TaxID=2013866 RepID=UPI000BA92B14|nr:NAD(P)-dependent oxidoreductase [Paraferrimonas haliotis]